MGIVAVWSGVLLLEQSMDLAGEQWQASHALSPCPLTEWMVEAGLDSNRGMY